MPGRGLIAWLLLALSWGCGSREERTADAQVQVAAAASLQYALPEVAAAFEQAEGTPVALSFAASGMIASQIRSGAPIDLFCSADAGWVERLLQEGVIEVDSTAVYATGRLVLAFAPGVEPDGGLLTQIAAERIRRLGVSNPRLSPYGAATEAVLKRLGLWDAGMAKAVIGENVGQVLAYVEGGNVDAAFLPRPLALREGLSFLEVDESWGAAVEHVLAIPLSAEHPEAARRLARFICSEAGRRILARHGFGLP